MGPRESENLPLISGIHVMLERESGVHQVLWPPHTHSGMHVHLPPLITVHLFNGHTFQANIKEMAPVVALTVWAEEVVFSCVPLS